MSALKQSVYYAVGIVMMKGLSMVMLPYVTHQLTPYLYGVLETLLMLADITAIVSGLGIIQALQRFLGESKGLERQSLVSCCFTLSLLIATCGMALMLSLLPWLMHLMPIQLHPYQIILIAIPALLDGVVTIPLTLMRMQAKAKWFCVVSVGKAVIQALITIGLMEQGWGIDAVLVSGAVSSILLLACLIGYQWRQMGRLGHLGLSWKLLRYGWPIVVSSIGLYAISGLDRWILADRVGIDSLAYYAVAVKFALILSLLMQPFTLWWFPNRFQILKESNGRQQCADNAVLGTNIGIYAALVMILTVPAMIGLILPPEYQLSASLVVGLLVASCLKNAGDLMNLGCYHGDSNQVLVWVQWSCAALAIVGYLWLIPVFGLWAAVWVLVGIYLLRFILLFIFSQRSLPLPYKYSDILKMILLSVAGYAVYQLIVPRQNLLAELAIGWVLSLVLLMLLVKWRVFPDILAIGRKQATIRKSLSL